MNFRMTGFRVSLVFLLVFCWFVWVVDYLLYLWVLVIFIFTFDFPNLDYRLHYVIFIIMECWNLIIIKYCCLNVHAGNNSHWRLYLKKKLQYYHLFCIKQYHCDLNLKFSWNSRHPRLQYDCGVYDYWDGTYF